VRHRVKPRFLITCCVLALLCCTGLAAQQNGRLALSEAESLPPGIVLVLRLVSSTHVEPTTGVVLSEEGLILVPAEFAGPNDEIIVLDGGTDIIRNGRTATIQRRFFSEGLTVLSAPGLKRPPLVLSADGAEAGKVLQLNAFPPAEMIAQGASPLRIPADVIYFEASGRPGISAATPLPNVTGPLLDGCGQLAGMSTADGVQSMATTQVPRYHWVDGIRRVAEQVDLALRESPCVPEAEPVERPADTGPELPPEPEPEPGPEPDQKPEAEAGDEAVEPADTAVEDAPDPTAEEDAGAPAPAGDILPPHERDTAATAAQASPDIEEPPAPPSWLGWLWLPGAAVLFALAWLIHRFRRKLGVYPALKNTPDGEPDTQFPAAPAPDELDALMDSVLVIEGVSAGGAEFRHTCLVSRLAVNVVVGRSNSDINIDSPAISRHHLSLNGTADALTLSDLGSSNGTSVNGVPCYEDEIFYLGPEDAVVAGDVRFSCEIVSRDEAARREEE
jgi:hypothetical protein